VGLALRLCVADVMGAAVEVLVGDALVAAAPLVGAAAEGC
jgi:hypothetical protein